MTQLHRTAKGLAEYAKRCMCIPHVYVWDANGEYITHALLDALSEKYPDWYNPERLAARRALAGRGVRGWDCIGLIKSYVWGDYHQGNTQYYTEESDFCTRTLIQQPLVKGDIGTLPEVPGLVLFKPGHVGVYIGGGKAIESILSMPASAFVRCWNMRETVALPAAAHMILRQMNHRASAALLKHRFRNVRGRIGCNIRASITEKRE